MGCVQKIIIAAAFTAFVGTSIARAWTRPNLPTLAPHATEPALRLDYILVEVNSTPHLLRHGDELAIIRGDRLVVRDASLRDRHVPINEVNVVGFQSPRGGNDDRAQIIDSAKDFKPRFSEDGKDQVYAITAGSKTLIFGAVFLRLVEPSLRYAEISVNGQRVVLRDGEPLNVHNTDKVKVERVVTNLESHAGVKFQLDEVDPAQGSYEIRFTRSGLAFATIPLRVKE